MTQWHGDRKKRKITGGRKWPYRGKRTFEMGREPVETELGDPVKKIVRGKGGQMKKKLLKAEYANVSDPSSRRTEHVKIIRVLRNPVSIDYNRRNIITKSAIIETSLGEAIVTSRTGQDGVINAVLLGETA
ncbi:MAG: 30S ribosomal protein S8e [Candidatus Bathyarchaeia archaeon]